MIDSLGLPGLEPTIVEGAGVFFRDFDVQQVELRLHEVAKLLSLRLALFVPHARELLVLEIFDPRRTASTLGGRNSVDLRDGRLGSPEHGRTRSRGGPGSSRC